MATGCTTNRDDGRGLPTLSLGLSSVRHIVNKLEAQYASTVATDLFDNQLVKYDSSCLKNEDFHEDYTLSFDLKRLVLHRFVENLSVVFTKCIPKVSFANFGALAVATGIVAPRMISYLVLYPFCRLVFGTLYPAYASYKAVRTKNLKEYVKWMMYWIVFALFTCTETITDVFLSWFPFYYEVKIVLVLWLLSPATKGSSILYRKFVHPALCRREQEIDEYIAKAKDQGYHTVLNLGTKGVNYATTVIMQTAIKNFNLPSPERGSRLAIESRDVPDSYHERYEDLEFQRSDDNVPGVRIVELDHEINNDDFVIGDGDANDPDYTPDDSSARSRGNVVRKRKVVKEKRSRSKSRGRRTRSQAAMEKEKQDIVGGGGLVQQLRKSYSLSDLTECEPREERGQDEADDVLAEPRLIRRAIKSGYATRRSASESNRSTMYFPEVDVDVRNTRTSRLDEPDFSHIKSTEDISSGYSSAENSASLTRTGSVGASARSRVRTSRTTVTAIKRPQAAEDVDCVAEELHDIDSFDYSNMPPLVDLKMPIFLSNTVPAFLYQHVGEQIKILQILGSSSLSIDDSVSTDVTSKRDQKEMPDNILPIPLLASENKDSNSEDTLLSSGNAPNNSVNDIKNDNDINNDNVNDSNSLQISNSNAVDIIEPTVNTKLKPNENFQANEQLSIKLCDDELSRTSVCNLEDENNFEDGDDEASFGTPEPSPKCGKKQTKGKYGKNKAPLPPNVDDTEFVEFSQCVNLSELSQEVNVTKKDDVTDNYHFSDNKDKLEVTLKDRDKRSKSKSPNRSLKGSSSTLEKIFQLPGKLAFWQKAEDKSKPVSIANDAATRLLECPLDEFQSCLDISTVVTDVTADTLSENTSTSKDDEANKESISEHILEKSEALQKLIDEKLETHPEYKFVPLHEEIPTTSKSTDV